jgi:RNA polymerase sigma factor (sigma-70 family)
LTSELLPFPESDGDDPRERFGIIITARCRHAALWKAARKLGSNKALAAALGVSPSEVGNWVNLRRAPHYDRRRRDALAERLLLFTGQSWDELWPAELREAIRGGAIGRRMEFRRSVELTRLAELASVRLTAPDPAAVLAGKEDREQLRSALHTLTDCERRVIEFRFGLDGGVPRTLEEVARIFGVTNERVRVIQARAIEKLRHPARVKNLSSLLTPLGGAGA